jgi:hypothetical protein
LLGVERSSGLAAMKASSLASGTLMQRPVQRITAVVKRDVDALFEGGVMPLALSPAAMASKLVTVSSPILTVAGWPAGPGHDIIGHRVLGQERRRDVARAGELRRSGRVELEFAVAGSAVTVARVF